MVAEVEPLEHPGIPEDVMYIRDPLDRMVALLNQLVEIGNRGNNPAASRLPFPFTQSVRFRAEWLVITSSVAAVVTLEVGSAGLMSFPFAAADTKVIPFPVLFDRGVDHSLSTSAGVASGFVVGYVDES
jgi:hypothetical protein